MCNPTKNPPPGTTPSAPTPPSAPTTARSLPPLSPASTLSGMSSASSGQPPNSSTPNNPNNNNESPPMLKLVSSLRNSGDVPLPQGQESRDDRNWKQRRMRRQSPPESDNDDEDDEEDEIPSLVDEAPHQVSAAAGASQTYANINHEDDDFAAWQKHRQQQQPPSPPKRRTPPRESFKGTTKSTPTTPQEGSAQTTPHEGTATAALPFFVLDYMIEDLVPKHQNAEELADLLNDKETALSPKRSISFSPLRKTKSCGLVGWSNCKKPEGTENHHHDTNAADPIRTPTKSKAHPTPSTSESLDTMPPLPITPKSSNRKHSKMQGFSSLPSLDETSALFVPRNLNESLRDCEGNDRSSSPQPKLKPKVPQHSPHSPLSVVDSDHAPNSSLTKKSASCPQLHRGEDDPRALQLRRRAQEQHDRRERRNKLTVVQRSLTLAQVWNNKGLIAAGKATRSHEQHQLWEASLECWDNALEIYRSLLGESHERVADVQNNRGIALGKLGFVSEALEALGMALDARKKQQQRRAAGPSTNNNNKTMTPAASTSAAIVSTLHNIANVFRDAGNPSEALGVLVEAQNTLLEVEAPPTGTAVLQHRHYCWHQSARLSTAIGHVYYESESWRDAREAYVEALEVYQTLSESLARQSSVLGWDDRCDAKRAELLHHQKLIQKEVANLTTDLDELDRSQQAKVGGRARLLQTRRQQQQQQKQKHYEASSRRLVPPQQQQQQQPQTPQQQQQQPQSIFGIVSSLRT